MIKVKLELELEVSFAAQVLDFVKQQTGGVGSAFKHEEPEAKEVMAALIQEKPKKPRGKAPLAQEEENRPADTQDAAEEIIQEAEEKGVCSPPVTETTLEMVREVLSEKVEAHRETITAKFKELGAAKVSVLDPSHYEEMYEFLKAL